mgnify:CR=1 FL=1
MSSSKSPNIQKLKQKKNVRALIKALRYKKSEFIPVDAAYALGEIGNQMAVPPLIERLQDDSKSVRRAAISALGHLGDPSAVVPLIPMLEDRDVKIREVTALALGEIRDEQAVDALMSKLEDDAKQVSMAAERALIDIADTSIEPRLLALMTSGKSERARMHAINLLGALKCRCAVLPLIDLMKGSGPGQVRARAAQALGMIADPQAVGPITLCTQYDEDLSVREAATEALGSFGEAVLKKLLELFEDWSNRNRNAIKTALIEVGEPAVMPLIERLEKRALSPERKEEAVEILGVIGDKRAVDPLIKQLGAGDWSLQKAAVESLMEIQHVNADCQIPVQPLIDLLVRTRSTFVLETVVGALGACGDQRAIPAIKSRMHEEGEWFHEYSLDALVQLDADLTPEDIFYRQPAVYRKPVDYHGALNIGLIVDELCRLIDKEKPNRYASEPSVRRAKELGHKLNQEGGFDLMKMVMQKVIDRRPFGYELVNHWWDGIGNWRY